MARDMHTHDERLTRMVLTAMHDRLAMDPVPLDRPGDVPALTAQLDGLITAGGTDPHRVMEMWTDVLAPHVMSSDAVNFLAFIPAAPTKAALLFDMLVSGASIQGISALEAAGAIAAENQVLRLIADLAGLPASAGGVFVSGGSAGNLSALTVARDTGRRKRGLGRGDLTRVAVSDQAHSSIKNALSILDMEALVVPTDNHVLTGPALAAALDADPDAANVVGVVATSGTTNAGIIDELATVGEVARRATCGSTWTGRTAAAGSSPPRCARCMQGSSMPTRSSSTRTSGCSRPTTAPPCSTASRAWPRPCTPRTPATSM